MDIQIRKMDLSDIPYVYNEELKIFGKSLGEKTLYNEILYNDMSRYFIAVVNDKRAGYIGSWLTLPNAEILNLFVSDQYRGLGIGSLLIDEIIMICNEKEVNSLTVQVSLSNIHVIKLYKELGFKENKIRTKDHKPSNDIVLMVLELGVK